jgi:small subunit ribosomal protein S7
MATGVSDAGAGAPAASRGSIVPRRSMISKREAVADPIYGSPLATKFINCIMKRGKKSVAEWIFYGAMDVVKDKTKDDPIKTLKRAVDNVKPLLEVKSRRVGGATYQVPVEVNPARRQSLAIRWIISYASQRASEKQLLGKLANELLDASNNRGAAIKKKEDTHKMAEANKAFAHYRW